MIVQYHDIVHVWMLIEFCICLSINIQFCFLPFFFVLFIALQVYVFL